jgi:hypothetical protein
LNYDDAIAKVENIINSFSTSNVDHSQAGAYPTVVNSAYMELASPPWQR